MTSRRDVIDLLIMENTNLIGGYQSHLDVEEYYESITLPKKLSTTEFIEVVNVEVQKEYLKQLREGRTKRMTATDFLMVSDFPYPSIEIKTAWRNYRQALRDLPATNSTVQLDEEMEYFVVTWPTAPIWPANVV
jgi:hypothetical protein